MAKALTKLTRAGIGVLGGSFNPVHNAHLALAQAAYNQLGLETVLLLLAGDPPHKDVNVKASLRYEMLRLASCAHILPCDIELYREGKSYTYDSLGEIGRMFPGRDITLILGDDMFLSVQSWYMAEELLKSAHLAVLKRDASDEAIAKHKLRLQSEYGARVSLLELKPLDISSTGIRQRVNEAKPISSLVNDKVERYIYENALYQPERIADIISFIRGGLSPSRFSHTIGVMICAIELADIHGIDPDRARLAALLHDCGRISDKSPLTHALTGAELAKSKLNIFDEQVLCAIAKHTLLGAGAGKLDRLIYLADAIEPSREYEGVDEIRRTAKINLLKATRMSLENTLNFLNQKGIKPHGDTLIALNELNDI